MKHTKYSVAKTVDPDVIYCDFCQKPYKTERGLENHIEAEHSED